MANENSRNAKRVVSGLLALSIVAGQTVLPANVGAGGLFGKTLTASAEKPTGSNPGVEIGEDMIEREAAPVDYVDENGDTKTLEAGAYTAITSDTKELNEGWYVVNDDVDINGQIAIKGDAKIVLCDGAKLTVTNNDSTTTVNGGGDAVYGIVSGAALSIYGQNEGTGELNANAVYDGIYVYGNITINGGTVNATTGKSGITCQAGELTINGGTVNAKGSNSGIYNNGGTAVITINGGTVNATGGGNSAIGAQCEYDTGKKASITINGGNVTAVNSGNGNYGILAYALYDKVNADITINGGTVDVSGAQYGIVSFTYNYSAATGNGSGEAHLTINDGTVTANGSSIGLYANANNNEGGSSVEINDGTTTAIGGGDRGAVYGTVKNAQKATGWTDTAGQGDGTQIPASLAGQTIDSSYKRVVFEGQPTLITAAPTANTELTSYTGEEQALVTAGTVASGYKMVYKVDDGDWSESLPTGTDAKTYAVWYGVVDANAETFTDVSETAQLNVTIAKADPSVADFTFTAPDSTDYDGNEKTATVTKNSDVVGMGNVTVKYYALDSEGSFNVSESVTPKEVGTYKVCIDVADGTNYSAVQNLSGNDWQFTIDYAETNLSLLNLGDVKVTDTDGNVIGENDGAYTLQGTKSYYVYTNKSIAGNEIIDLQTQKTSLTDGYKYRYTITIPTEPAEGGYTLSHTNKFVGKVSEDPAKSHIMDIEEDNVTYGGVATLKSTGTIYYGDKLDADDLVDVLPAFESIVSLGEPYLENDTTDGGKAKDLVIGETYKLTVPVTVDADGDTTDGFKGNIVYLKKTVTLEARPMYMNDYYLKADIDEATGKPKENAQPLEVKAVYSEYETDGTTPKADATITGYNVIVPEETYTYNGKQQKPTLVVLNGGNNADVVASIPATDTADAVAKDYIDGVKAETDAGDYSYTLTAETGTTEAPANYSGAITVKWSIAQADISKYIAVAPKNNVDTDEDEKNDAIVYDGAALDGTDFEVTKTEAYDNADEATKALVDEYIAQLEKAEGETEAKTKVEVEGATTNAAFETTIVLENDPTTSFNKFLKRGIETEPQVISITTDGSSELPDDGYLVLPATTGSTRTLTDFIGQRIASSQITVAADGTLSYTVDNVNYSVPLEKGNDWYFYTYVDDGRNYYVVDQRTTPKTSFDIINAGNQQADVKLTNTNFEDVEFDDVDVTIAKREVTLTPDAEQKITYRDTDMPDLTYTVELAKEGGLTGVVNEADMKLFQKQTGNEGAQPVYTNTGAIYVSKKVDSEDKFAYVSDNGVTDYTKAVSDGVANNAGNYEFAARDDNEELANYTIKVDGSNEFTVEQLDLSDIDWTIVLNGKNDGWTTKENSGYYSYDGTTKEVEVKKVSKSSDTAATETFSASDLTKAEGANTYSKTSNGVTVSCTAKDTGSGEPMLVNSSNNITITVPTGAKFESVKLTVANDSKNSFTFNEKTYTPQTANDNSKYVTIPESDITAASDSFTITSTEDEIRIDEVTVNYTKTAEEYVLEAGIDYTVGGSTKKAGAGEYQVQVKGTGNYTGVATADWYIGAASVDTADSPASLNDLSKTYDGKAVKARVTFTDPTSDWAKKADITYTYYKDSVSEENKLDGAPADAGTYVVVAEITSDGYSFKTTTDAAAETYTIEQNFTIEKKQLDGKIYIDLTYGDKLPNFDPDDLDTIDGWVGNDKELLKQVIAAYYEEHPEENSVLAIGTRETVPAVNEAARKILNNYSDFVEITVKAKSIKSEDIIIELDENALLKEDDFTDVSDSVKVYDARFGTNEDGTYKVQLEAGVDYEVNADTTAQAGTYNIEVVGQGNYKGRRTVEWNAEDTLAPYMYVTKINTAVNPSKPDVEYVQFRVDNNIPKDIKVDEFGMIYVRGQVNELTVDTEGVTKKSLTDTTSGSFVRSAISDTGSGISVVPFAVVDGKYYYGDIVYKTYADVYASENAKAEITKINTAVNSAKPDVNYVQFRVDNQSTGNVTVDEFGMVYIRGQVDELNVDTEGSTKKSTTNTGSFVRSAVSDTGSGISVVPYVLVGDKYYYGDIVYKTWAEVKAEEEAAQ